MADSRISCVRLPPKETKSQRLRNPFLVNIDESSLSTDNYQNGLKLNITCECSFWVYSFWSVNINDFHYKLALDWMTIRSLLIDGKLMEGIAEHANDADL